MEDFERLESIISGISPEAPKNLAERIILVLAKKRKRAAQMEAGIYFGVFGIFLGLFSYADVIMSSAFYQSGTTDLLSLLFSDFNSVISNFSYFIESVMESLPVIQLAFALLCLTGVVVAATLAFRNFRKVANYARYNLSHV